MITGTDPQHLADHVIRPILLYLGMLSEPAVKLLLGTAAQESQLGRFLKQLNGGPGLGIYQVEPDTHDDVFANFLRYRADLAAKVLSLRAPFPSPHLQLKTNLGYATAIARLVYWRDTTPLPTDIPGMAGYWKRVFNTTAGRGRAKDFEENYGRLVRPFLK